MDRRPVPEASRVTQFATYRSIEQTPSTLRVVNVRQFEHWNRRPPCSLPAHRSSFLGPPGRQAPNCVAASTCFTHGCFSLVTTRPSPPVLSVLCDQRCRTWRAISRGNPVDGYGLALAAKRHLLLGSRPVYADVNGPNRGSKSGWFACAPPAPDACCLTICGSSAIRSTTASSMVQPELCQRWWDLEIIGTYGRTDINPKPSRLCLVSMGTSSPAIHCATSRRRCERLTGATDWGNRPSPPASVTAESRTSSSVAYPPPVRPAVDKA